MFSFPTARKVDNSCASSGGGGGTGPAGPPGPVGPPGPAGEGTTTICLQNQEYDFED